MSIEIKQMIIKSTLINTHPEKSANEKLAAIDTEQMKEQMLEECRTLISESLLKSQER